MEFRQVQLSVSMCNALVWWQSAVAEDPITTQWVKVFDSCTRYSKSTGYVEYSRYDACSAPEQAVETVCTWIAAVGRACTYRDLTVNWMNNQELYKYCTRPGIRLISDLVALLHALETWLVSVHTATTLRTTLLLFTGFRVAWWCQWYDGWASNVNCICVSTSSTSRERERERESTAARISQVSRVTLPLSPSSTLWYQQKLRANQAHHVTMARRKVQNHGRLFKKSRNSRHHFTVRLRSWNIFTPSLHVFE